MNKYDVIVTDDLRQRMVWISGSDNFIEASTMQINYMHVIVLTDIDKYASSVVTAIIWDNELNCEVM